MRPNYSFYAASPATRNDFIDLVSKQTEAIVLNHELLEDLRKEINEQINSKKSGKFFKRISIPMALLSLNPLGWLLSGITFLCGVLSSASDDLKKYKLYAGCDASDSQIVVLLHKKKVDLSYDKIIYPSYVKIIDYKKSNKKIK